GPSDGVGGGHEARSQKVMQTRGDWGVHLAESPAGLIFEFGVVNHPQRRELPVDSTRIAQDAVLAKLDSPGGGIAPKTNLRGLKIQGLIDELVCRLRQMDDPTGGLSG